MKPRSLRSRYLAQQVLDDLERKMVFLAGPRQVGKTTLALSPPGAEAGYLNWDIPADRERILTDRLPSSGLRVFDEIHKDSRWRDLLKGLWDSRGRRGEIGQRILVTGSARLDLYRYSGDSLQGRYHLLRMHPLSAGELGLESGQELELLLRLGGFPEPFLGGSETEARRWSREHRTLIVREEADALEDISDLGLLERLALRLPELVGSPLSINALREDLQLSHATVARWLDVLERLYALFRITPYGHTSIRALKKARKHYHFDWTLVRDEPARFENLVACHLLKWIHHRQDTRGEDVELRYFRDSDGREVDFVVVSDGAPELLVECKWHDRPVDKALLYLKRRFPEARAWQISMTGRHDTTTREGVRTAPALELLRRWV